MSLDELLRAVAATDHLSTIKKAGDERQKAEIDSKRLTNHHWHVDFESRNQIDGDTRGGEAALGKTFHFGHDREALQRQFEAETEADVIDGRLDLREEQLAAARLYASLLNLQRTHASTSALLGGAKALSDTVVSAGSRGTVSSLAALKWQYLYGNIEADRDTAAISFAAELKLVNRWIEKDPNGTVSEFQFADIPPAGASSGKASHLEVQALEARGRALGEKARVDSDVFEIEGALGVEHQRSVDTDSDTTSIIARLTIPLGQGSSNRATQALFDAERRLLAAKSRTLELTLQTRFDILASEATQRSARVETLRRRVADVRGIYDQTVAGFSKGLADLADLTEALELLHEAESGLLAEVHQLQLGQVELLVLQGEFQ